MKKILFIAAIALLAMGCCKKTTSEENACPCPEKKECCKKECPKAAGETCAFEEGKCPCPAKCAKADSVKCCKGVKADCPKAEQCSKTECPKANKCPKADCPKTDSVKCCKGVAK